MSRISLLLVAAAVAGGVVGCAQCDTCDDFPAPCTGPNCGNAAMLAPTMTQGMPPTMGSSTPTAPAADSAGPAPDAPPPTRSPATPPVDPTSPPPPMDPFTKPN